MIPTLIEAALRSLLLACAVWAGLRVFRVRNVVAQKAAWGLVLCSALLMPLIAPMAARVLPVGATWTLPTEPAPTATTVKPPVAARSQDETVHAAPPMTRPRHIAKPPAGHPIDSFESAAAPVETKQSQVVSSVYTGEPVSTMGAPVVEKHAARSLASAGWIVYLAVACILFLRLLHGLVSALDLLFTAESMSASERAALGGLRVRSSRAIASPVTIGSTIILPATYADWDADKLRIVVAHERSHIRQGDFYLQLLAAFYASLVWFSPLGWWLKRELSDLAETISDRAGLEEAASTTSYAQILLEFAAAPRPTVLGVAMARPGSLSRRVERLLNDHAFRQAFAGGRRRAIVAVLLVPVALFAATAFIRVQAAQDAQTAPAATPAIATQPASSAQVAETAEGAANPEPADAEEPAIEVGENAALAPKSIDPVLPLKPTGPLAPIAPATPSRAVLAISAPMAPESSLSLTAPGSIQLYASAQEERDSRGARHNRSYIYSVNGSSYALISGDHTESMNFSGDIHTTEIDKVRKMAHGDFLWFARDDKQYYVDDPATIAQIEAMYKPMEELGKQQEALGRQQEELGKQQEGLGRQQEQASIPTPDMRKEMEELTQTMAKLQAKIGQNVTQQELSELQDKLGDLQGMLGELQGQIGSKQGEFGAQQGKLGEEQGRLGAQQGKLGEEQGRIGREADRKVRSIIDQSLENGKAHPVN
jgi:beta-lactamase regulating signal transducer with metallopeptidase domain